MRSNILSLLALASIAEGSHQEFGGQQFETSRKPGRKKAHLSPAQEKKKAKARKKNKNKKQNRKK